VSRYLVDTDVCVWFLRGLPSVRAHFRAVGYTNCDISEITLAELLFGVHRSSEPEKNRSRLDLLLADINVRPISDAIETFAREKARLKAIGTPVADFDLLIGATARRRQSALAACDDPPRPHAGDQQYQALPAHTRHPAGGLDRVTSAHHRSSSPKLSPNAACKGKPRSLIAYHM
jgi:tRNA(fMet)-specific endonuclease VapC